MELTKVIDLDNLQNYSNVDPSTIIFDHHALDNIAKLNYEQLSVFIDIFDDVNKEEAFMDDIDDQFTFGDAIVYSLYSMRVKHTVSNEDRLRMHFKLLQRGYCVSVFDSERYEIYNISPWYDCNKTFLTKYCDAITNLQKLTNNGVIYDLDRSIINCIKMLLLICKTRVVPKYIMLYKILPSMLACYKN